jgi:endonuclease YncB( thermonuclease family)
MNLERSRLPAVSFVVATVLAACATHAQATHARACDGSGAGQAEVARVIDGRSFLLADGREVRLAAIETVLLKPGDEDEVRLAAGFAAKAALEALVLRSNVDLVVAGAGSDRYRRLTAYVFAHTSSGEVLVQHALVTFGHALVSPDATTACRTYLRDAERSARVQGLGFWSAPSSVVKNAADVADILAEQGRFAVVQGKVASVRESAGVVYINFGQRRSDQFTAALLKRNERIFAGAGMPPKSLAGHTVEVRGFVEERAGPTVEVMRPEQIDIVH